MGAIKKVAVIISVIIAFILLLVGLLYSFPTLELSAHEYACDKGVKRSCHYASVVYLNGKLVKKDVKKAESLAKKACQNIKEDGSECLALGYVYLEKKKFDDALKLFVNLCKKEDPTACLYGALAEIRAGKSYLAPPFLPYVFQHYSFSDLPFYNLAQIYALLNKPEAMMWFITQAWKKDVSVLDRIRNEKDFNQNLNNIDLQTLLQGTRKDILRIEEKYTKYKPCELLSKQNFSGVSSCYLYWSYLFDGAVQYKSGIWQQGALNGKGMVRFEREKNQMLPYKIDKSGSEWCENTGLFVNGILSEGAAIFRTPNHIIHAYRQADGTFKDATFTYENGDKYIGRFRVMWCERDGKGKLITIDGKIYEGVWKKDQLIKPTPESDVWPTKVEKSDKKKKLQHHK